MFLFIISVLRLATLTEAQSSPYFKLVTYTGSSQDLNPTVSNWHLTYSPSNPNSPTPYAILVPPSNNTATFYVNGTYWAAKHSEATLNYDFGNQAYGMTISPPEVRDAQGRRTVQFAPKGNIGIGITPSPMPQPALYYGSGHFYVCRDFKDKNGDGEVRVYAREYNEVTPSACAELIVLAKCVDSATAHAGSDAIWCCRDVTGHGCVS
ncbi:hypothetical protein B0J14DRAFT_609665 [Halenospora varia]|nr:hypothetical protein B0J14DRAFT_609665 [Halenospora varia]